MYPVKSKRVLLVDDDEYFRSIIKRQLLSQNYEIVGEAEDGEQAIKLFKSIKPDLTLLDFEIPGTIGTEVLEAILTLNPDAVVIMLTGREDIETMQQCVEKGAFHFLRKDYPPEVIYSVIEESFKIFSEK